MSPLSLGVSCVPGNSFSDGIAIDEIPIAADGSFKATELLTEDGVVDHEAAQFTRTFQGHFHGFDNGGSARFAGQVIDKVTYDTGGTVVTCHGSDSYLMTRNSQGSQTASPPPAGRYSEGSWRMFVSPDSTEIQDVYLSLGASCVPSNSFSDGIAIDEIPSPPTGRSRRR